MADALEPAGGNGGPVAGMDAGQLRAWLVARVAAEAGIPAGEVAVDQPFSGLGLDSARLIALSGDLARALGRPVDPTMPFEHPTIAELAAALTATRTAGRQAAALPAAGGGGPVAIVGLACRLPGAPSAAAFWELLTGGVDAITEVPPERWDAGRFYDPDPAAPGRASSRWGGFIDGVDRFDARFFRISADEATRMDPQQRLLLEVAYEALEDAGELPARLRGSRTGVYVGISVSEYASRQLGDPLTIGPYTPTGNALSVAANRLSYAFDLRGPSVAVDTACSSSLVALHLACRALRAGDCDRAVVAGVNLLLDPEITIGLSKAGMLAPDGRCKAFSADANGYVRGEGCGVVVLKPLDAALAAGDRVYAVVLGSAINADGASNGLTAPNPAAQQAVIEAALADAGTDPAAVGYVECHGTGTPLGDPIEARALGRAIGMRRRAAGAATPCRIGSVKSNIGHLEAAAGIAGLIKTALALHNQVLPPSIHLDRPNPHIPLDELGLEPVTSATPWRGDGPGAGGTTGGGDDGGGANGGADGGALVAGVSSFGFGGANAHAVLASAPERPAPPAAGGPVVLPLSARSPRGLERHLAAWAERLDGAGADEAAALAFTAATRRTHHRPFRLALLAEDAAALPGRVRRAADDPAALLAGAAGLPAGTPRVAFAFSGQGTQWPGMARGLLDAEPLFASTIRRCDEAVAGELGWSLEAALRDPAAGPDLDDTAVAQPLLAAVQIGLARVWQAWGIEPVAVVGHSIGEVAAAVTAGILDPVAGLRLALWRGRRMGAAGGEGRMLAVGVERGTAERLARSAGGQVALAAVNGPRACVLSGDAAAIERIREELAGRGEFARPLEVGYAFHSPRMLPASQALLGDLDGMPRLAGRAGAVPFYSTVLGRAAGGEELDAAYWARGVSGTVEFAAAAEALLAAGADALLEIGPQPALRTPLRQLARAVGVAPRILHSLERGADDATTMLTALCQLYTLGCQPRWERLYPGGGRVLAGPPHPWERERYWLDRPAAPRQAPAASRHPLLGERIDLAVDGGRAVWQASVGLDTLPALADHRVAGAALLPATAYVELALAAAADAGLDGPLGVSDLELLRPLALDGGPLEIQTTVAAEPDGGKAFTVHARPEGGGDGRPWALHARARLAAAAGGRPAPVDLGAAELRCLDHLERAPLYGLLAAEGLEYGPSFQGVREAWRGDGEALGTLAPPPDPRAGRLDRVRLLDAAFHVVAAALGGAPGSGPPIPVAIGAVRWWAEPDGGARVHARATADGHGRVHAGVTLLDADGRPCAEIDGLELRRAAPPARRAGATADPDGRRPAGRRAREAPTVWRYEPRWRERSLPAAGAGAAAGRWLVLTDTGGVGDALVAALAREGVATVACGRGDAYAGPDGGLARIDPTEGSHYQRLVDDLALAPDLPLAGVLHLWCLDEPAGAALGDEGYSLAATAALHLVRALSYTAGGTVPRLVVASRGCQPVGDAGVVAPLAAATWGLLKTAPIENPLLKVCCVDLDPGDDDPVPRLVAELLAEPGDAGHGDAEVAWRGGRRLVRRLTEAGAACPAGAGGFEPGDGTWVLTGGTGALGLRTASWLVERGVRHLVLLSRGGEAAAGPAVEALRRAGATVLVRGVDVTDRAALAATLAEVRAGGGPPITGVVHAAGVLDDRALLDTDAAALRRVLAPKVLGAAHLHELTKQDPLGWFVLYASAAGVLGSPGQAAYSAANAYLDALAHHRHGQGLPAVAIDWGPWAEAGMAAEAGESGEGRRLRTAVSALQPADGLAMLGRLLGEGRAQAVVLPFDLRDLLQFYPAAVGMSFFDEIATAEVSILKSIGVQSSARPDLATEYVAPRNGIEQRIVAIWQKSLGIEPIGVLDSFFELGGDSVFGNQILVEVNRTLGVAIEPERAFQELTVAHLAALAEEQMVGQLERMTDEEAERLLAQAGGGEQAG